MARWLTWRDATEIALYGERGFFRRPEGPGGHFRTSVHASTLFAEALLRLLAHVDERLGRPGRLDFVDVGAGRGELLRTIAERAAPHLRKRLALHGVDLAGRPPGLPPDIGWSHDLPDKVAGLLIANEWLDDVPVDVVEQTSDGVRLVLVDPETGQESLGDAPDPADLRWLETWWPLDHAEIGARAEIGRPRDEAWACAVRALGQGVAVAVDYAHGYAERARGLLPTGTLTGYRAGRQVPPVPDGSCDITSHVALDACAVAGEGSGAAHTLLSTQRELLHALGVNGQRPPASLAADDPLGYLKALAEAGEATELTARGGLGDFGWLAQAVGTDLPEVLSHR